jgi:hypothetical protein
MDSSALGSSPSMHLPWDSNNGDLNKVCLSQDLEKFDVRETFQSVQAPTSTVHGYTAMLHPYARLANKAEAKRTRKIWSHALEKKLFSPYEL